MTIHKIEIYSFSVVSFYHILFHSFHAIMLANYITNLQSAKYANVDYLVYLFFVLITLEKLLL